MSITVSDAMKLGKFSECEIVAGHKGINRVIDHITIMEVPEIAKWLKSKELLLTSLFAIKDDEEAQVSLVQKLNTAGASGLAIKPTQFVEKIPECIIQSANELNFPVIIIPDHIKYLDILTPVMNRLFNDKVALQEDVNNATSILEEITLNNDGIETFIDNLEMIIKNKITVESEFSFEELIKNNEIEPLKSSEIQELSIVQRPIKIIRKYGGNNYSCIVAPIIIDDNYYGNITSWTTGDSNLPLHIGILEKASTLLSLEFLKIKAKYDIELEYENDFMRELLFSQNINRKNIIEWGSKFNFTDNLYYECILLTIKTKDSNEIAYSKMKDHKVYTLLKSINSEAVIGFIRNGICIITPLNSAESKSNYELYCSKMQVYIEDHFVLSLGVGRIEKGIKGIQKSFRQSDQALNLNQQVNREDTISLYDDLGIYLLLDPLKGTQEYEDFYDRTLGDLIYHDKNQELLETLKLYFSNNEVLKATANDLYIHINTLKYRMKKIEEITNCSLKTSEGKLNLYIALKICQIKQQENENLKI